MKDFTKIIRFGTLPMYTTAPDRPVSVFCKVEYKEGCLSITGVEGPRANGDAWGGCGQIDTHLREPGGLDGLVCAPGWTLDMVQHFLSVWNSWHLNHMRAYNAAMKAAGWGRLARKPMLGYEFTLTSASYQSKRDAEADAQAALRSGETFTPSPAQVAAAVMPYSVTIWRDAEEGAPIVPEGYQPARHIGGQRSGDIKAPEPKTLGWLTQKEHPDGLLSRPLNPGDKETYGGAWYEEAVPEDVLVWLAALPDTDRQPAWV